MLANHTQEIDTGQSTSVPITDLSAITVPDLRPWDSSDPFFSARTRDLIKTVFTCYVRPPILFLGIPGNIITCIIFFKQGLSDRVNLLLFWLAVADLSYLLSFILYLPTECFFTDTILIRNWATILRSKLLPLTYWSSVTSGALIVIMSVDRCLSVVFPFKARRMLSYRPMVTAILLSYLSPVGVVITVFFANSVQWRVDPSTNRSVAYMTETAWFPVDSHLATRMMFLSLLITKPIFIVLVAVFCVITIINLWQASHQRLQMTKSEIENGVSGDTRITRMLLFLCVLYAVVLSLETLGAVTQSIVPGFYFFKKYHNSFVITYQSIIQPALFVNASANFFAYLILSSRFRGTFKKLFRGFQMKIPAK